MSGDAWRAATIITLALLGALAGADALAGALRPVTDAMMAATKAVTAAGT